MARFADGLINAVSGQGTARDKQAAAEYALAEPTWADLLTAYRVSWLAKKIVDIPAQDSVREWRSWNGDAEQVAAIQDEEERLRLVSRVLEARTAARLFGGGLIYIDVGDEDLSEPLNPERIGLGGIRTLVTLTPQTVVTGVTIDDPRDPWFGHPADYRLTISTGANLVIHPSRMVRFDGAARPDRTALAGTSGGWDDSVLMAIIEEIKRADSVNANVASLVHEAKVDVFGIPNLMNLVDDPRYEEKVAKRLRAAALGKGNHGALVMDAEETYNQKTFSFGQLPEIIDRYQTIVSGAADIPTTRLFGRSPAGENSTGESDLRNYYDMIRAQQTLHIGPAMNILDECLIRSALGDRPDDVDYEWAPLWQVSDAERANILKTTADAARTLAGTGGTSEPIVPIEALSDAVVAALIEQGTLPGLEAAIDEFGRLADQPEEPEEAQIAAMAPPVDDPAPENEE